MSTVRGLQAENSEPATSESLGSAFETLTEGLASCPLLAPSGTAADGGSGPSTLRRRTATGRPGRSQAADAGRGRRFRSGRRTAHLAIAAGLLVGAPATGALADRTAAPSAAAARVQAAAVEPSTRLAIPSYFTDAGDWSTLLGSGSSVGLVMVNPASGPGTAVDPTYTLIVNRVRGAGIRPLAYVPTSYGTRPIADVLADIAKYRTFYGLTSIFFDEAPNVCTEKVGTKTLDHVAYYQQLFDAVHAQPDAIAVLNPGTNVPQCYLGVSDVLVTFEASAAAYATWTPDAWTSTVPADHFWHLIHSVAPQDRAAVVATATSRRAGYVYATPDGLPNPWGGLGGSSFQSMVSALSATRPDAPSADSSDVARTVVTASQPGLATATAPVPAPLAPAPTADPIAARRPVTNGGGVAASAGAR